MSKALRRAMTPPGRPAMQRGFLVYVKLFSSVFILDSFDQVLNTVN
jgi:hypothetical protein